MADDTLAGGAAPDSKTTLHDDIGAVFDAADKAAVAAPVEPPAEPPAGERARDSQGRFVAKDTSGEPAPSPVAAPSPTPEPAAVTPAPAAAPASIEPLQHWPAELKEKFGKVPAEHRGLLQDVIKNMETAHQRRVNEVGEYGRIGEVLSPHAEQLKQAGYTPATYVAMLKDTHLSMLRDPAGTLKQLAQSHGVDLGQVGGAAPAPAAEIPATDANGYPIDPAIKAMLDSAMKPIKDELEQRKQREAREAEARTTAEIQTFADAKDPQGNLLRPYFAEVYADLVALAAGERANGRAPTLQTLYDRAVWANPSTREKLLAAKSAADAAQAEQERKAKTDAARKAAVSVAGNGAAVPAPTGRSGNRRDDIAAEFSKYDAA